MKTFKLKDCNGHVAVIVALSMIALATLVGLGIDSGRAYGVKVKLNAAVDAAAIAAAKALSKGYAEARLTGKRYFEGNYPDGYLSSTPVFDHNNIGITETADGILVTVPGTAVVPATFMRIKGWDTITVNTSAGVIRRPVDLAFVVDNTGSIGDDGDDVIDRSKEFVNAFLPDFDRLALIKYAFGAEVPVEFTSERGFNINTVETEINAFDFDGGTNCAEGFWNAKRQHNIVDNPANLRVIVFFTDGVTNTFASTFKKAGETSFTYDKFHSGSIATQEEAHYAAGFWLHYKVKVPDPSSWSTPIPGIGYYVLDIEDEIKSLPRYYNPCIDDAIEGGICVDPHTTNYGSAPSGGSCGCSDDPNNDLNTDPADLNVFNVLTSGLVEDSDLFRSVTQLSNGFDRQEIYRKINRASRNLLEEMARKARRQGIFVYTLGLGPQLRQNLGPDNEKGEDLLIHMANVDPGNSTYNNPNHNSNEPEGIYCYAENTAALGPCYDKIIQEIIRLTM